MSGGASENTHHRVSPGIPIPRRGSQLSRGINSPPFAEHSPCYTSRVSAPLVPQEVNFERFRLETANVVRVWVLDVSARAHTNSALSVVGVTPNHRSSITEFFPSFCNVASSIVFLVFPSFCNFFSLYNCERLYLLRVFIPERPMNHSPTHSLT